MNPGEQRTPVFWFGKHKGQPLAEIPSDYLTWALREVRLSTGIAQAVRDELARRGVAIPPPEPKPRPGCQRHLGAGVRAFWLDQSNRRRAIRSECVVCGSSLGILPQTPENVALAEEGTDRAALLAFLTALEDAGIEVSRRGRALVYSPPGLTTREQWRLEKQCRGLLLDLLPDGDRPPNEKEVNRVEQADVR